MQRGRRRITVAAPSVVAPDAPTLTAPADESDVYPGVAVTVSATVTAGQVPDRVDFVLDPGGGEEVIATDSATPFSQSWTPTEAQLGAHTLVARFVYGSGSVDSTAIDVAVFDATTISGCVLWLPEALPANVVTVGGDVSQWTDLSGLNHHALQGTATNRPLWEATGFNGRPSVLADGVDNFLKTAPFTLNQPCTIICAVDIGTPSADSSLWDGDATNSMRMIDGAVNFGMYAGDWGPWIARTSSPVVIAAVYNGASSSISKNNGTPATGGMGANNPGGFTLFKIGGGAGYTNMRVGEVAIYDSALSAPNITRITRAFGARWGIAVA